MKILVTGRGGAGSWTVRGEQIGQALGATVKPQATLEDCRQADVILVTKRVPEDLLRAIQASGRPWAYDIVDAYPQPECSGWSQAQAVDWVRRHLAKLQPSAVIWPNARMRSDCGGTGEVIYHHHRPGIEHNPVRERVRAVGYEGAAHYLGVWWETLRRECDRRGWSFVMNPGRLADLDVVVAMRAGAWNGYVPRHWKSNVKLANAHGSGTPFVGMLESGYEETAVGCEYWAGSKRELATALDWIEEAETRRQISQKFLEAAITVQQSAEQFRQVLCALRS